MRTVAAALLVLALASPAEQDLELDAAIENPAYPEAGPTLCIDEAHRNHHTAGGRYAPLARLLRNDGYRVVASDAPFTGSSLGDCDVLLIANAFGRKTDGGSAFTRKEIGTVRDWVEQGGSLLLIADHPPFGAAANGLSLAFGVRMIEAHVKDEVHNEPDLPGPYFLRFEREDGLIGAHPTTEGRTPEERIQVVVTFGGQALDLLSSEGISLLRLSDHARLVSDPEADDPEVRPATGLSHAIALEPGEGRVVVVGEAGLFSAQILRGEGAAQLGLEEFRFGMTRTDTDDRQLVLNIVHWLSRLL